MNLYRGSQCKKLASILVPLALLLLLGGTTQSLPRFSAQYAADCSTCHVGPTGAGMRNEFGNHVMAFQELVLPWTKKLVKDKYKSPRLSESATFGFDLRYLVLDDGRIFRMQTDAYVNVTPFTNLNYQIRFWENGILESYGLLYLDEEKYHIRLGRFYPSFGLHNVDHKAYNRERTGHPSQLYLDGVGMGGQIGGINVVGEYFNPENQAVYGLHAFKTGRVSRVGYLAGGSLRLSEQIDGSNGQFPHAKSLFGAVNYDRWALQGELDLVGKGNDTLIAYAGAIARIEYGLFALFEYNFFDGDREVKSGVDEFYRLSLEVFPLPFVELRPSYTRYTRGLREGEDDFFVQFHLGY